MIELTRIGETELAMLESDSRTAEQAMQNVFTKATKADRVKYKLKTMKDSS